MKTKSQKVLEYLLLHPDATTNTIAFELGVSTRLVRYVKEGKRKRENGNTVKILFIDIETSPMEVLVWGLYKQRIPVDNVLKDWAILSWSAKWMHEDEIMSEHVSVDEARVRSDRSVLSSLWVLLDKADIVVAHNGIRFDVRKINARFIENGFDSPSPYQVIDTLKISQKNFAFSSHKLVYLMSLLGSKQKGNTTYSLWKRCINGDASALKKMEEYNIQDVVVLEELYLILRPWIKSHANLALFSDGTEPVCPSCGSDDLKWEYKYNTTVSSFPAFRCNSCGAFGRSRFSSLSKEARKNLTAPVAR